MLIHKFEDAFSICHPVFDSTQFGFSKSDQTVELYGLEAWGQRELVIREAIERMRQSVMNASLHSTANSDLVYERPFRIDEMLEDEFEMIDGIDV
jgi:hypothetical protein